MMLAKRWTKTRKAWKLQMSMFFQKLLIPTLKVLEDRKKRGGYVISLTSLWKTNCRYSALYNSFAF